MGHDMGVQEIGPSIEVDKPIESGQIDPCFPFGVTDIVAQA